jgi:hypothetical protein
MGLRVLGFLALWLGVNPAWAGDLSVSGLPTARTSVVLRVRNAEFGFVPKGPEQPAIGPSAVAAGPHGAALIDPVERRLLLVEGGQVTPVPLPVVPDAIAAGPDGRWYALVGRSLWILGADGERLEERPLPDLVPTGVTLAVDGAWVSAVDAFGNLRPLIGVDGSAWTGGALVEPQRVVRKVAGGLEVDGAFVPVEGKRVAGKLLGDWLIAESVSTGDAGALEVQRWGMHLRTGSRIAIPTRGRRWVPDHDLSVDPSGALWILSPTPEGLDLVQVQP